MAARPFNFSAGPATLPEPVLQQAAAEMLDWRGSGIGVMEMSHRGPEFGRILHEAEDDLRRLLAVPPSFKVLFMQGGGMGQNAIVPLNLSRGGAVDVVVTGSWSAKSLKEASRYGDARAAASTAATGHRSIPAPASWALRADARYVHVCTNETIHGVEFQALPDLRALGCEAPLVIDCSSHIASRPIDWSRVGLAFAGAQKNIGPAGLTLVIVHESLLGRALPACPTVFDYAAVAEANSMVNTPPTWGIYIAGLVFRWLLDQREGALQGLAAVEARNQRKAALLYEAIDRSRLYINDVDPAARSRMNVPFRLRDESLNERFLAAARERDLVQLKGHKSVGGMRASLYNAMPTEGVQALVDHLREFEARHG
jgi:phosphoserine aminotransferase